MFAFLFRSASSLTKLVLARNSSKVPSLVGGFVAGGALTFMSKDWHRTLSLYVATRALECAYNVMKTKGFFKGISMYHGDALLFAVSSAQVMYSYVMRKETLPKSYHRFIVRQGPVDKEILSAVCANNRGLPLNLEELRAYVQAKGGPEAVERLSSQLSDPFPKNVSIALFHPNRISSLAHTANAFVRVVKKIFPVYFSLSFAPTIVLRSRRFFRIHCAH